VFPITVYIFAHNKIVLTLNTDNREKPRERKRKRESKDRKRELQRVLNISPRHSFLL